MRRLRPGALFLLAIAIAAILGHVCAPAVGHTHGTPSHDGHHRGDQPPDALHAASCEAVRSTALQAPIVMSHWMVTITPAATPRPFGAGITRHPVVVANSPPLYLLHASLLI